MRFEHRWEEGSHRSGQTLRLYDSEVKRFAEDDRKEVCDGVCCYAGEHSIGGEEPSQDGSAEASSEDVNVCKTETYQTIQSFP